MRYKILFLVLAAVVIALPCPASDNRCVNCHGKIEKTDLTQPVHSFKEWRQSIHAKKGVTCDVCHGGNPQGTDQASAHKGIERSSDPGSRIYFNKIPETCGSCHVQELENFKRSSHYKELKNSGKGPNCVTCHGSMATRVLSPRDMDSLCNLCHQKPTKAYATLLSLDTSRKLTEQLRKKIREGESKRLDVSGQSADLKKAEQSYREALLVWHSFVMEKALPAVQDLNHQIRNSLHELELKMKSGDGGQKRPAGK